MKTPEKTNLVLWFFGQSAAGKETLVRKIEKERPAELLGWLDLDGYIVRVCDTGFVRPGTRQGLVDDICVQLGNARNTALLVKGQDEDLRNNRPQDARNRLPKLVHRIVFVRSDPNEVFRRWQKQTGREHWTREGAFDELNRQLDLVGKLRTDFVPICVDATDLNYKIIDWPG